MTPAKKSKKNRRQNRCRKATTKTPRRICFSKLCGEALSGAARGGSVRGLADEEALKIIENY